jgi:hypothetical protein
VAQHPAFCDLERISKAFHGIPPKSVVLQKIHHQSAKLRGESCASLPESVSVCDVCCLLAQLGRQHLLGQSLAANTGRNG